MTKKTLATLGLIYLIPILAAVLLFTFYRLVFTGWALGDAGIGLLVAGQPAEAEIIIGKRNFSDIAFRLAGLNHQVTDTQRTSADPSADRDWLVWMEQLGKHWQIFVHHIPTEQTMQLTQVGNNVNPISRGSTVAWERFDGNAWQIFAFDGARTRQISNDTPASMLAAVSGQSIIFTKRAADESGLQIFVHNMPDDSITPLSPASYDGEINVIDNEIVWTARIDGELAEQRHELP